MADEEIKKEETEETGLVVLPNWDDKGGALEVKITEELISSPQFMNWYYALIKQQEELSNITKQITPYIKNVLEDKFYETGDNFIKDERIRFSYLPGSTKTSFNEKEFKKDYPELYKKYITVTPTNSSVRVTTKKEKADSKKSFRDEGGE